MLGATWYYELLLVGKVLVHGQSCICAGQPLSQRLTFSNETCLEARVGKMNCLKAQAVQRLKVKTLVTQACGASPFSLQPQDAWEGSQSPR